LSVLDDLLGFEQRVVARLNELRPLVAEYEELERVAARMGIDAAAPAAAQRATASPAGRKSRPQTRRKRAPRGRGVTVSSRSRPGGTKATGAERRARIVELVSDRPGITVSEISKELGVDPPPLYRVVRKLQADGVIKKEGTALRPS
jgi:DNA invertase Pin-like site-specific DNA recombinase